MIIFKGRYANSIFACFHLQVIHTKVWEPLSQNFWKLLKENCKFHPKASEESKLTQLIKCSERSSAKNRPVLQEKLFFFFFSGLRPERNPSIMRSPEDQVYTEWAVHGWKVGRGMANGQAVWTAYIFRVCLLELCCVWAPEVYNMQAAYRYTVAWWGLPGTLSHWCDCEEKLLKRPVHMGWVRGWLWPLMQRAWDAVTGDVEEQLWSMYLAPPSSRCAWNMVPPQIVSLPFPLPHSDI